MTIDNKDYQRAANLALVARMIWRRPGLSRVRIAEELGLYRSTVSNIIQALVDGGLVEENRAEEGTGSQGRRPIELRLRSDFGCVLGIEMQVDRYKAALVGPLGNRWAEAEGRTPFLDPVAAIAAIEAELEGLKRSAPCPLLGVCVGMPGIVDPDAGRIVSSISFGAAGVSLPPRAAGVPPLLVENDANCCAWGMLAAERARGAGDFLCVLVEPHEANPRRGGRRDVGVGVGVAMDGKVYRGRRFAAGEFFSATWRPESQGQVGRDDLQGDRILSDDESYRAFVADVFQSLLPLAAVLDPAFVSVHGDLGRREALVRGTVADRLPGLSALLGRLGCELVFPADVDVATGAALMYFQRLFSVPPLGRDPGERRPDWDRVLAAAAGRAT